MTSAEEDPLEMITSYFPSSARSWNVGSHFVWSRPISITFISQPRSEAIFSIPAFAESLKDLSPNCPVHTNTKDGFFASVSAAAAVVSASAFALSAAAVVAAVSVFPPHAVSSSPAAKNNAVAFMVFFMFSSCFSACSPGNMITGEQI